jgi:hypothetical protein
MEVAKLKASLNMIKKARENTHKIVLEHFQEFFTKHPWIKTIRWDMQSLAHNSYWLHWNISINQEHRMHLERNRTNLIRDFQEKKLPLLEKELKSDLEEIKKKLRAMEEIFYLLRSALSSEELIMIFGSSSVVKMSKNSIRVEDSDKESTYCETMKYGGF